MLYCLKCLIFDYSFSKNKARANNKYFNILSIFSWNLLKLSLEVADKVYEYIENNAMY